MERFEPTPFDSRSEAGRTVVGGLVPAAVGALAGVLVGISAPAYWAVALVAAVGAVLAGLEHAGGWEAADRGFLSGLIYGTALLLAHELAGTHAKVSLGSFPPILAVITTIAGTLLTAAGGRLARERRAQTTT